MHKLSYVEDGEWRAHSHRPIFSCVKAAGGINRVIAGVPAGDAEVFARLVSRLAPPYMLLYVLHSPRDTGREGRYQSGELSLVAMQDFLIQFGRFLAADGRFDIWAHSPGENGTVVWDRHNLLYGYGPIDRFSSELRALGFDAGEPNVPVPHAHFYREEFDNDAREVLQALSWTWSPLQPEDKQGNSGPDTTFNLIN